MIPLLTVMGVPIHTAVGTCLAFVACSGLAALLQHVRRWPQRIFQVWSHVQSYMCCSVCSLWALWQCTAWRLPLGLCIRCQQPLQRHRDGMSYIASAS
jgi:hypothetical protein